MNRTHSTRIAALLFFCVAALCACGGYSTQEANRACEDERARNPTITDESFALCVACYETCGEECTSVADSPPTYVCPD